MVIRPFDNPVRPDNPAVFYFFIFVKFILSSRIKLSDYVRMKLYFHSVYVDVLCVFTVYQLVVVLYYGLTENVAINNAKTYYFRFGR